MRTLLFFLLLPAGLGAAPKAVGYLRVVEGTPIYHGASLNSKQEATVRKGDVYELVSLDLNHGFYKIDYDGHVSWIPEGAVIRLDAKGTPVPTPRPTADKDDDDKKPTPKVSPTRVKDEEDEDDDKKPTPKVSPTFEPSVLPTTFPTTGRTFGPTRVATIKPTIEPTVRPTIEPTVRPTIEPTVRPTIEPTVRPTIEPTVRPTVEPTVRPTVEPTVRPTVEPTVRPTVEPTVRPTVEPTVRPTVEPTVRPTVEPTVRPTIRPTQVPTVQPTMRPTIKPTAYPTPRPTARPTTVPAIITPSHATGKRRSPSGSSSSTASTTRRSGSNSVARVTTYQFSGAPGGTGYKAREAGHLDAVELVLPMGLGKHEALVQPPFKPSDTVNDQRPIEFAGFIGLGLEYRVIRPLRFTFEWTAHSHRTKGADLGLPAPKVNVPGLPTTTIFDESQAWYRMNAQQLDIGIKLSLPHPVVEPWVGAGYGAWIWSAELSDMHREITYGEDHGVAWGGTLSTGIDFHGSFGSGLGWTLTPFVEWGAPVLEPTIKDIAGLGVDWKDSFGTPAAVPARVGLQLGIGF